MNRSSINHEWITNVHNFWIKESSLKCSGYWILVWETGEVHTCEGKGPLGRPGHRWENNIKMDLEKVGRGGMDLIELAQDWDRWWGCYVVRNLWVP